MISPTKPRWTPSGLIICADKEYVTYATLGQGFTSRKQDSRQELWRARQMEIERTMYVRSILPTENS
jgi:hypothetical protein